MTKANNLNNHSTLEMIKVPVVLDGDLAASLSNILIFCHEHNFLDDLLLCDHVHPKLDELMERINSWLDIENREEA